MLLHLLLHGIQLQILDHLKHVFLQEYYFRDFLCNHMLCYLYKHCEDCLSFIDLHSEHLQQYF